MPGAAGKNRQFTNQGRRRLNLIIPLLGVTEAGPPPVPGQPELRCDTCLQKGSTCSGLRAGREGREEEAGHLGNEWPGRKGKRVPAVSLGSSSGDWLDWSVRTPGRGGQPRARVGWSGAWRGAVLAGPAREGGRSSQGQWEVLDLRPAWGWGGRGPGRGLCCQLQSGRASPRLSHRRHRSEHGAPGRPRRAAVARPPAGGPFRYGLGLRAKLRLGVRACGDGLWDSQEHQRNTLPSHQGAQSRGFPPGTGAGRPRDVPDLRADDTPTLEQHSLRQLCLSGSLGTLGSNCDP